MTTINQLSAASELSTSDLLAVFVNANGDARKTSLANLAAFILSVIQEDIVINETFAPSYGSGITVAPTNVTAASALGSGSKSLVLTNLGSVTVYVHTGTSTVTATTADYPVLPATQVSISKDQSHTHIAYITASGTGSLHAMAGEGF